jgi:hypothetical protein
MLRRAPTFAFLLAAALVASACIGSLKKTFRDQDVVTPKVAGLWSVTKFGDAKEVELPRSPWVFRASEPGGVKGFLVDMEDPDERNATLEAVFFKIGKQLYAETTVHKQPGNALARLHQLTVRIPSRVELKGGVMKFYPLDGEKLKANAKDELGWREHGKGFHDFVTLDGDATKWHAYLKKHGAKAFAKDPLITLKRYKD